MIGEIALEKAKKYAHEHKLQSVNPLNQKVKYFFLNFEDLNFYDNRVCFRWIEHVAIDYVQIDMFTFLIFRPIGGEWQLLENATLFLSRKECMKQKDILNSPLIEKTMQKYRESGYFNE